MRKISKPLLLILISQAVCLALGLWFQVQFTLASAKWTAERDAWAELSTRTADWMPAVQGRSLAQWTAVDGLHAAQGPSLEEIRTDRNVGAVLVDAAFCAVGDSAVNQTPRANDSRWTAGQPVGWRETSLRNRAQLEPMEGRLKTSSGTRPALAYPLARGDGFVITYWPEPSVPLSAATIIKLQPGTAALTFVWTCGLQCIITYLFLSRVQTEHSKKQMKSEEETLRREKDLLRTRDAVIFGLAKLAESRDPDTGHHLERISMYSTRLACAVRRHPRYRTAISSSFVRLIGISSALHDIGKVGVEDAVLLKPGKLDDGEFFRMQAHAKVGGECIKQIERRLGTSNFLEMAREIALYHHERWDGTGYPHGLKGERIPLSARIVAIADVYDALSVRRVYKEPFPHSRCVAIIREEAGRQFDPELVDVFLKVEDEFREIAARFSDSPEQIAKEAQHKEHEELSRRLTRQQEETLIAALTFDENSAEEHELVGSSKSNL